MSNGYQVVEQIDDAHPRFPYPLLPGDLLVQAGDGTWCKECPGIAVVGLVLTPEQVASLRPVSFDRHGLAYVLTGEVSR